MVGLLSASYQETFSEAAVEFDSRCQDECPSGYSPVYEYLENCAFAIFTVGLSPSSKSFE